MDTPEFEEILSRRLMLIKSVLSKKACEYSGPGYRDRLHNFTRAAAMLNCTREKALIGMAAKHLISILDLCDDVHVRRYNAEFIEEKIGDAINYLILLEAMLKEDSKIVPM